ncbi:MAG TPA: twin-arginine translocation signal domain-containing protein, partial [Planctomycetota bacterium]|nr:twin-arginine translocation signal domain-containing protein [Planctomycetota bacterium]
MSNENHQIVTPCCSRRHFLQRAGAGFGMLALADLLSSQGLLVPEAQAGEKLINPLAPKAGHFPTKAKSAIWLFMNGGQSQVDT